VALQELILAVGVPLVSTSANRTGQAPAVDLAAAATVFGSEVDGVWADEREGSGPPTPSALVDLTTAPFAVLRAGPAPWPPRGRGTS
jgi:tRNA A37 threonylcarbamoyladenosine synthetase subunit TsaC/SUA5/YrdC